MKRAIPNYEELIQTNRISPVLPAQSDLHGGWEYKGFAPVRLSDVPWQLRNDKERPWNNRIHCWDMLDNLLRAHSATGDGQYIRAAVPVALDWIARHGVPGAEGMSPYAWAASTVGLRTCRLAYVIDADDDESLGGQDLATLRQSLTQHLTHLDDEANIALASDQGFFQAAGLLAAGRRFGERDAEMARYRARGNELLLKAIQTQFCSDGTHREHSPQYHLRATEALNTIVKTGLTDDPRILALVEKIEKTLSWFIFPDRHLVNFGDTHRRPMSRNAVDAVAKWRTAPMQYVATAGVAGAIPMEDHAAFAEGGYFVVRKPSANSPRDFSCSSYLAQTASFHSPIHKHADDLSFVWSDLGSNILIDSGSYGFVGKTEKNSPLWLDGFRYSDPNRIYCESTSAHNALEFDGLSYKRRKVKAYGSAIKRWSRDASGVVAVETICKQFAAIRHARVLVYFPAKWLVVFDWFKDYKAEEHSPKQWFHLAPGLEPMMDKAGMRVTIPTAGTPTLLRIAPLFEGMEMSKPSRGQTDPVMQGWLSSKEREIEPSPAFCFTRGAAASTSMAALFTFSKNLSVNPSSSSVTPSGLRARFRWKDETGHHIVTLERPGEGKLSVSYIPPSKSAA